MGKSLAGACLGWSLAGVCVGMHLMPYDLLAVSVSSPARAPCLLKSNVFLVNPLAV